MILPSKNTIFFYTAAYKVPTHLLHSITQHLKFLTGKVTQNITSEQLRFFLKTNLLTAW